MLSVIPRMALWPLPKVKAVEKVVTQVTNIGSLIQFSPPMNVSDNMMAIPSSPITVYDSQLNKLTLGAYDGVNYPCPYALGNSFLSIASVGGKAWLSQNKGQTWTLQSSATYTVGMLFRFKNQTMVSTAVNSFNARAIAQNLNGTPTLLNTGAYTGAPSIADFGAKNANCIVTSGNHTTTATTMYVCWTFPNFVAYNTGADQAVEYHYLGNNIFYTYKGTNTRFYYVPATQGTPVLLRTKATSIVSQVVHLRNQVIYTTGAGEVKHAPLAAVVENPAINVTDATNYLIAVLAAIEGAGTTQLLEPGVLTHAFRWGFDRFVVMTRRGTSTTHIWQVNTVQPSVTFTIKAGVTGTASYGSTGFSIYNGNYGYGTAHGQLLSAPSAADVQVITCGDWRQTDALPPYGGFGLLLNLDKATLLSRYVAVKTNGRTFSLDSLETTECRAFPYPGGTGTLCNWMLDLAEFVNGQTYTVELIPR